MNKNFQCVHTWYSSQLVSVITQQLNHYSRSLSREWMCSLSNPFQKLLRCFLRSFCRTLTQFCEPNSTEFPTSSPTFEACASVHILFLLFLTGPCLKEGIQQVKAEPSCEKGTTITCRNCRRKHLPGMSQNPLIPYVSQHYNEMHFSICLSSSQVVHAKPSHGITKFSSDCTTTAI